ncbi:hypothetical protein X777_00287 [Ooceraea biroi]|uniref:U6 snRNA phosphodiesterase n=1 Tax=Ooceraea biroi TaxID=2015173 RepID=A0A026WWD8_OOCBI|nr:hypothetical protein X777_00287 [Ooceraea biroi]
MAGLQLIKTYSSDSDEDRCDEKKQDDNVDTRTTRRVNNRLAVPETILSWKGVTYSEELVDDPFLHDGRTRSFKHERDTASERFYAWIKSTLNKLPVQGHLVSDLHVSLSRTLVLKYHWIPSFIERLRDVCCVCNQFVLRLTDVRVYRNEERTRTFLGIRCQNDDEMQRHLIAAITCVLDEYRLLPFAEDDSSYHVSFFWCLGDEEAYLKELLPSLTESLSEFFAENPEDTSVCVNEICCKVGNKYRVFRLK